MASILTLRLYETSFIISSSISLILWICISEYDVLSTFSFAFIELSTLESNVNSPRALWFEIPYSINSLTNLLSADTNLPSN